MSKIVVNRNGRGGASIEGWIPGQTKAVITYRGLGGEDDQRTFTAIHTDQIDAMRSLEAIELYVNIELVSAELVTERLDDYENERAAYLDAQS